MPSPIATYFVVLSPQGTSALTTTSFTPSNGEDVVIKLATWDTNTAMGAPTGGSQTYTSRVINAPGGFNQWCGIYTTTISGSPGSMTISSTPAASARASMLVERWPAGSLAASPVTHSTSGSGAAAGTITPTAGTSVISWVSGDAQSVDPATRAYLNSGTDEGVRDDHIGANGVDYHGRQDASGTSSQSYGLSLPTGQTFVIAAIEILDAGGATPIVDPTWAPHRLIPPGRISPAGFWVPWRGDLTAVTTSAPAVEAVGAGSALDAVVALGANAAEAIGSGTALDATAALTTNAAEATGTGVANDATVSTSGSTNAPATEATGTGTANDAQAAIGANAAEATGTGAAQSPQITVTANAAEATGTGSAADAVAAVTVNADVASGTGSALDATVSTSAQTNAPAAEAVGAGSAYDATITLTTFAGVATATGAALDATVLIGGPGSAFAGVATGVGTAYDARVRKLIPRPNTGTTSRPYTGITLRP